MKLAGLMAAAWLGFLAAAEAFHAYPNPWRADRDGSSPVTFTGFTGPAEIKIFTIAAEHVKSLSATGSSAAWDLTNDAGERVASGVYFAVVHGSGEKSIIKFAVIR